MKKVEIYTTPSCMYCKMTKSYFAENNVSYTEHDVSTDLQRRQEMIEKSQQMGVPVILVDDQMVIGFNKAKLASLLGLSA